MRKYVSVIAQIVLFLRECPHFGQRAKNFENGMEKIRQHILHLQERLQQLSQEMAEIRLEMNELANLCEATILAEQNIEAPQSETEAATLAAAAVVFVGEELSETPSEETLSEDSIEENISGEMAEEEPAEEFVEEELSEELAEEEEEEEPAPAQVQERPDSVAERYEKQLAQKRLQNTLAAQRYADLSHAMSLNDRFRYQRELFQNNREALAQLLAALDTMEAWEEAEDYLRSYQWDEELPVVQEFYAMIEQHFNN